jgi:putative SOS response-associated peptidase YedK
MCYSALVEAAYHEYLRQFGADIDFRAFYERYVRRDEHGRVIKLLRGMDRSFRNADAGLGREIAALVAKHEAAETARLEQELFALRKRLADAERKLAVKPTKAATDSARIATAKLAATRARLADLKRADATAADRRIFPGVACPVMVWEQGRRVVKPMRYQLRPPQVPASFDRTHPGTYNARRDALTGFWRGQFGVSHGLILVDAFYEHVWRHRAEGRDLRAGEAEQDVVIEFQPDPPQRMLAACLWASWSRPGEDRLDSFALITDEPPPEVAAAGHDRCIIPIRAQHIDAWLNPDRGNLAALQAILDDRERPTYRHRLAEAA